MIPLEKQLQELDSLKDQAIKDIEEKYDKLKWDAIDTELEKPIVKYMTYQELVEKYGDYLDDHEKELLKNLTQNG